MEAKGNQIKGKKLVVFKLLALLFPFVLLILMEISLRIFNYGHNTDLFIRDPHDDRFMVMNYYASEKYFSDTLNATKGNQELFAVKKASNTFRIFVLGESTTIGYPYRYNGSFHRWLQYRLMQMYPDRNFEVINLSLTAVNSYTVLDFGKQLHNYQPDAVLVYTGHNEYYGALGIGSTSYLGSNRFLISVLLNLRTLKTVQLLSNTIKKIGSVFSSNKIDTRENLMKRMAARQQIAYQSTGYQSGIRQFEQNMNELCSLLNDQKIPVFLSTVVSNEKDLPPFISESDPMRSAVQYYKAGNLAYSQLNYEAAKNDFVKAKEYDELRFHAPQAINIVIRQLSQKYPAVHLVDTRQMFEQYSPHGIIGQETLLEHVHPNLMGYALMSDAFYQAIQRQHLIRDKPDRVMSFEQLLQEMPVTRLDSLNGVYQMVLLKAGWPFNQPIPKQIPLNHSLEDSLAIKVASNHLQWIDAMHALFEYARQTKNKVAAAQIMEASLLEYPQSELFCNYAAKLNAMLKNYDKAAVYYKKLYRLNDDPQAAISICQMYLLADEPGRALANIQYVPREQQAYVSTMLSQLIKDKWLVKIRPDNQQAKQRIAEYYKQLGANETALKYRN